MVPNLFIALTLILLTALFSPATSFASKKDSFIVERTVHGGSMEPLLKNRATISVQLVDCQEKAYPWIPPKRGDIVVFKSAAHKARPLIKRVAALTGDTLALGPKGTVLVNGHAVIDPSGKKYTVIPKREGMIKLYAGTLPKNTYLVFGNSGTIDSSRFGLISCEEIIGIVKR